ncbi:MAG: helix-turn-helix transcriptional regulator [Oscillospiraceae bacterium]|nr:helix-turn-helix transcriptional regulator [Oscillospiraceae bacterium]
MQTKDILKDLRKSKGFSTMQEFCNASNISFSTYQNYESGKRLPTAEFLMQIADFYGVTTDYLLGREAKVPEPNPFAEMNLSKDDEKEVMKKYMAMPEEVRAIMLNVIRELGTVMNKPEHPIEMCQSTMVDCETIGEELERRQQEAEALRKDTA